MIKKIFIICLFTITTIVGKAQDILASTLKIGPFALEMKLQEVEAITLKKYSVAEIKKSIENNKPIEVQLNSVKFILTFFENYDDKGNSNNTFQLYRIKCNDSKVKTKSGITFGMDRNSLLQVVSKMDIAFTYSKYQEYENDGKPSKKFGESLNIYDSKAGRTLTIYLKEGKISGFEIGYDEGC